MGYKIIRSALLFAAVCVVLNSCWFNSTGKIIDVVSHHATAYTEDAKIGNPVLTNGYSYYVKLDHVYDDDEPNLFLNQSDNTSTKRWYIVDKCWFRVNPSFAKYLIGESDSFASLTSITPVSDSEAMTGTWIKPIVRSHRQAVGYQYKSPYSGWAYFFAPFEFLCIDIPVSLALNFGVATLAFLAKASSDSGTSIEVPPDNVEAARQEREHEYAMDAARRALGQ